MVNCRSTQAVGWGGEISPGELRSSNPRSPSRAQHAWVAAANSMQNPFRREADDDRTPETCECPKARAIDLLAKMRADAHAMSGGKWWVKVELTISGMSLACKGDHTNLETAVSMCHVKWLEAQKMGAR